MTYKRYIISDIPASFFILSCRFNMLPMFPIMYPNHCFLELQIVLTLLIDSVFTELVIFRAVFFLILNCLCFLFFQSCYIKLLLWQFLKFHFFDISYRYFILILLLPPPAISLFPSLFLSLLPSFVVFGFLSFEEVGIYF